VLAENYHNNDWVKSVRGYYNKKDLDVGREHTHNLQMFDWFFHHSQHGKHFVMAFEVLGRNLLSDLKKTNYRGLALPVVR
jgi:hypothetical protein